MPAFCGEWFCNRLRAGYCRMVNPFNKNHRSESASFPRPTRQKNHGFTGPSATWYPTKPCS
ncbi:MAG: DUF1848 domain-containing protein [Proteobacteria bacterium]|nr:DUF1848 domain-containing protein [Pseudomonadota bacterium]